MSDFQTKGWDTAAISYEEAFQGPTDKAIWTVRCNVNGQLRGTGVDRTKAGAKDAAAKEALNVSPRPGPSSFAG
ncbi:hypothetical protein PQX77_003785 [Marasmius sp. AFHP31]|nr:hypothetical protein PQX77_003785 [Marasmius sp. AFHP31]